MNAVSVGAVRPMGDLGARCALLMGRLEDRIYRPENIFTAEQNGWPGDWEGRTILALTLLSRATGRTASYLREIIARLPEMLNEKGYLGPVMPDGVVDEQQLSGHSWLLRDFWNTTCTRATRPRFPSRRESSDSCIFRPRGGFHPIPQARGNARAAARKPGTSPGKCAAGASRRTRGARLFPWMG